MIKLNTNTINQANTMSYKSMPKGTNSYHQNIKNQSSVTKASKVENNVDKKTLSKYDMKDATYEELCETSRDLLHSGSISLLQHMLLTLDHSRLPGVEENSPTWKIFNGEKTNWIDVFRERANQQLLSGNLEGYGSFIEAINILEKVG